MWISYAMMGLMVFILVNLILFIIEPSWYFISNETLAKSSVRKNVYTIYTGIKNNTIRNWEHLRPYYDDFNRESSFPISRFFDMLYMQLRNPHNLEWAQNLDPIIDKLDCIRNEVSIQIEYDEVDESDALVFKAIGSALEGEESKGLLKTLYNKQVEYKNRLSFESKMSRISLAISIIAFVFTIIGLFTPTNIKNIDDIATAVEKVIHTTGNSSGIE